VKHILIVDDEEAVCWALQRALAAEGQSTATAASAELGSAAASVHETVSGLRVQIDATAYSA